MFPPLTPSSTKPDVLHFQAFAGLALKCAYDLNKTFKIGLEEKCREGAKVVRHSFPSHHRHTPEYETQLGIGLGDRGHREVCDYSPCYLSSQYVFGSVLWVILTLTKTQQP